MANITERQTLYHISHTYSQQQNTTGASIFPTLSNPKINKLITKVLSGALFTLKWF